MLEESILFCKGQWKKVVFLGLILVLVAGIAHADMEGVTSSYGGIAGAGADYSGAAPVR
jgi:hypothetical protein